MHKFVKLRKMSSYEQLVADVEAQGANAEQSLLKLKVKIAKKELTNEQAKHTLELACKFAIACKDREALQRNLSQLKPFHPSMEYLAVELLLLLVQSKLADFFALLEKINSMHEPQSPHVDFVVLLERNLTEGSYYKALGARKDSTSPLFAWLLEDLEHTVRDEVASCLEVSYTKGLAVDKAAQLLKLDSLQDFALQRDWQISPDGREVTFPLKNAENKLSKKSIPTDTTIRECLNMAMELDRIV